MATDTVVTAKTARERVLAAFPTALAHDDGVIVSIRVAEKVKEPCCQCGHMGWTDKPLSLCKVLGNAGNSEVAWKNAAENLGLV